MLLLSKKRCFFDHVFGTPTPFGKPESSKRENYPKIKEKQV